MESMMRSSLARPILPRIPHQLESLSEHDGDDRYSDKHEDQLVNKAARRSGAVKIFNKGYAYDVSYSVDTGSVGNFVTDETVDRIALPRKRLPKPVTYSVANNTSMTCYEKTDVTIEKKGYPDIHDEFLIRPPMSGPPDVIIGRPMLQKLGNGLMYGMVRDYLKFTDYEDNADSLVHLVRKKDRNRDKHASLAARKEAERDEAQLRMEKLRRTKPDDNFREHNDEGARASSQDESYLSRKDSSSTSKPSMAPPNKGRVASVRHLYKQ